MEEIRARRALWFVTSMALLSPALSAGCEPDEKREVWNPDLSARDASDAAADAEVDGATGSEGDAANPSMPAADGGGPATNPQEPCPTAHTGEAVPARAAVVSMDAKATGRVVFTEDLFRRFKTECVGCHVDADRGGFRVRDVTHFQSQTKDRQQAILARLRSDDPAFFMPPAGTLTAKPYSQRAENDPIVELADLLEAWFAAGSPSDLFMLEEEASSVEPTYQLSQEVADSLTNMGSCIPGRSTVGRDADAMNRLDALFAGLDRDEGLPENLSATDLVTFDSEQLARTAVISFAPGYPLFSDNASKMRHVRVPRGQSIRFDEEAQEFVIPPNTRFYKTFLRKVIDRDGQVRYRKIETRLIVARPDGPGGSQDTQALFGTYAWDDNETKATLVQDPLRNAKPFRDRLITYLTDEPKAGEVLAANPLDKVVALREAGVTRNYAIPGSDRCVHCHMGGHNQVFILGFTPLQIKRRPGSEGGNYEESSMDELSQLQRLIDYGVITGLRSPDAILPLEDSQGDRKARNQYELKAQGYLLGNCSHCHNPRGFPSVTNPVLSDLLRFFPDREGGIFQFPLDRMSPRIKRGLGQEMEIPYITPSLLDLEPPLSNDGIDTEAYKPKYRSIRSAMDGKMKTYYVAAPWRSLIYRNVDTPFAYADDYALFPHMPMDTPGFDCRAPGIIGDWMVSIPSRRSGTPMSEITDPRAQPYVEVKSSDPDYDEALAEAARRLELYNKGGKVEEGAPEFVGYRRSNYCSDTSDIVDPDVGGQHLVPIDNSSFLPNVLADLTRTLAPSSGDPVQDVFARTIGDGVPDRAHWVVTDITDPPGDWYPRRSDWEMVFDDPKKAMLDEKRARVIEILKTTKLSEEFRKFALTPVPFGLWKEKDTCNLSAQPSVSSFEAEQRPAWMDIAKPIPEAKVYSQSPGAAVFNEVCINCHGANYDSRGRQADTLMLMTGGETRVANFRDGLFGPVQTPGMNRARAFGPRALQDGISADDWAARYMAWMGLGGTERIIPESIMRLVGASEVFGEKRPGYQVTNELTSMGAPKANMLDLAQTMCKHVIAWKGPSISRYQFDAQHGRMVHRPAEQLKFDFVLTTPMIETNGDAELWLQVCTFNNPPPVRIVTLKDDWSELQANPGLPYTFLIDNRFEPSLYKSASYPKTVMVGNDRGSAQFGGVTAENLFPWCMPKPSPDVGVLINDYIDKQRAGRPLPFCPDGWRTADTAMSESDIEEWSLRGAINAGFAVFVYLDRLSRDVANGGKPAPAYNDCEALGK